MRTPDRNQNIELLRIIAAFGIVVFHGGGPFSEAGYAGLICFIILATYFPAANWGERRNTFETARYFLLPWAFFTALHAIENWLQHGWILSPELRPVLGLLYGTGPHLWFLPFILVVLLAIDRLKAFTGPTAVWLISLLCAITLLALSPRWQEIYSALDQPLRQWAHAFPSVAIGLALGTARMVGRLALTSLIIAIFSILTLVLGPSGLEVSYGLGIFLTLAALWLPMLPWKVESVSRCMFGVYLVHAAALSVFALVMARQALLTALLAFIASFAGVYIARRYFKGSKYILG